MKLEALTPMLRTWDLRGSVAFYTDVLGFACESLSEEWGWASLRLDGVGIMLAIPHAHMGETAPAFTGSLYIRTTDIDGWWQRLKERARVCYPIETFAYGMREFAIYDHNGYVIQFGQPIAAGPAVLHERRAGAVLFAKDIQRIATFYARVAGLTLRGARDDHVVLESRAFQLVVVQIPEHLAGVVRIDDPPLRRESAAIKLVFGVASVADARGAAPALGGALNPAHREWEFEGRKVCDGHDPEGNVFQLREERAPDTFDNWERHP